MAASSSTPKSALAIGFGLGLIVLAASWNPEAERLENIAFDGFTRVSADPSKWPKEIVVVLIDDSSLQVLQSQIKTWPWPRSATAALATSFRRQGAKAVVFDMFFSEETDPIEDDRFATWLKVLGNVWIGQVEHEDRPTSLPIRNIRDAVGPHVGYLNIEKDPGGVVRRYFPKNIWNLPNRTSLAASVAESLGVPRTPHNSILLRWHGDQYQIKALRAAEFVKDGFAIMDRVRETGSPKDFDTDDSTQVSKLLQQLPPSANSQRFANQIVVVGCSATGTFDIHPSPLNGYEAGVMVQATALANLLRGDYILPSPGWMRAFLILASSLGVTFACLRSRRILWQSAFSVAALALILAISFALFRAGIWLAPSMALVAGAVSFTGVMTWNYFTEGRKSRDLTQLFSDFVSPDVLHELQNSPDGVNLRGDRRMGSVLFCDLAGFTTFTESAPPEQLFDAINSYLAEASQVLLRHDAYIDKFIGDAVMAIFGIPKPQSDHAVRACHAALDLRGMMVGLNERLGRQYNVKLGLRTGVNSGEMIAGPLGYKRKLNYSVLGDTVNLASRLEGANKEYSTLIMLGPLTYELAKDEMETRFLDLLIVKGKLKPVAVYELMERKGKLSPEQERLRAAYMEGIEHYRARRWDDARASFERALAIHPEDGPSRTYVGRCEHYKTEPPEADWDGSYGLKTK